MPAHETISEAPSLGSDACTMKRAGTPGQQAARSHVPLAKTETSIPLEPSSGCRKLSMRTSRPDTRRRRRACRGLTGSTTANCISGDSVPIRRPGESTVDRQACEGGQRVSSFHVVTGFRGGVHLTCCHWSSEPFSWARQQTRPPASFRKGQQSTLGGCRLHSIL